MPTIKVWSAQYSPGPDAAAPPAGRRSVYRNLTGNMGQYYNKPPTKIRGQYKLS